MAYSIKNKPAKEKKEQKRYKTYFYKWGKHHTSKYGGQDGILEVYEIKNGEIVKVGERDISTRAMKGFEGETMSVLLDTGKIDNKEFAKSESDHSGKGYYQNPEFWGEKGNNFKIKPLGDMY